MKIYKLKKFTRGWIIGNFTPSIIKTRDFEIGVKYYKKGAKEKAHYHKVAEEITIVTSGSCKLNNKVFKKGDIVCVRPNEIVEFEAVNNCTNTVIKIPSAKGDKFIAENQ